MSGYIYFIGCPETLRVKIGYTGGNPHARLRALQTGSPTPLSMIAMHPGTARDERDLHAQFAASRNHGEWFNMSKEIFDHMSLAVWLTANDCAESGKDAPKWVRTGLQVMQDDHALPEHLAALL